MESEYNFDITDEIISSDLHNFSREKSHKTTKPKDVMGGREKLTFKKEEFVEEDPELHVNDFITLILAEIKRKGISGDHINSMNTFYKEGIHQIITKIFKVEVLRMQNKRDKTEEDRKISHIGFSVEFTDVSLSPPTTDNYKTKKPEILTPNMAHLNNLTYSSGLYVSCKITATAYMHDKTTLTVKDELHRFRIASIPTMILSEQCTLYKKSKASLKSLNEDHRQPGGGFYIKGVLWAVDMSENLVVNMIHGYKNAYGKEIVRATFQSKPGDAYENSYYMVVRYLTNDEITVEIVTNKFEKLEIPYYLIFRAFGMTSSADIINNIVYGIDNKDSVTLHMMSILEKAFAVENKDFSKILKSVDPEEIMTFIASKMNDLTKSTKYKKDDNAVKYINHATYNMLDKYIFPHIGSDASSRIKKLRFFGHLIHKLLRIEMGILEPTDRDSYRNKRVHTAGICIGKTFKTCFNFGIVQEIKKQLIKDFQNTPFTQVRLAESVKSSIDPQDLEKSIIQSIITGSETVSIGRYDAMNRVSSQQVYQKNDLNVMATHNNITTHGQSASKATDRAKDMRMPHGTHFGYIGVAHSADNGESIGMNKQKTVISSIAEASSSLMLEKKLLEDIDTIPLDEVAPENINREKLTKIFVNGNWIGFCKNSTEYVAKYRNARRHDEINPFTTIVWEPKVYEIYFWVDVGRFVRPIVIVYNNMEEYIADYKKYRISQLDNKESTIKPPQFKQWIKLNKGHIRDLQSGKITMEDLRKQRVVEYISPEEQENILLALNYDVFLENKNNPLNAYTHLGIEQEIFGIVELSAPNTNHSAASRITMFTNHKKAASGIPGMNWPYRIEKNTFLQYYWDMPIIKAFSNAITLPNAQNVICAYAIYGGDNQEDSIEASKQSIDRGAFNGSHFNFVKTELESGEQFGNIDINRTLDIKKDAIYEYVVDGFIKVGTLVRKGYVLIVKTANITKPTDHHIYVDKSIIYKFDEPAYVENVYVSKNEEGVDIAKVSLRSIRPLMVGDKMSSHSGCKGIISVTNDQADMPYCEDGTKPDIIINPHSIPTRMVIGQIIETTMGMLAVKQGCLIDATPFKKLDIDGIISDLASKYGIKYGGHKRMYNGKTGNWFDTLIFVGPTSYQRLQKFVLDESYAMATGPTCALTRQPLDGKAVGGGFRVGEMEKDVLISHGVMRTMFTKFYTDSDGIEMYICRACGHRAIVNERANMYKCKNCLDNSDIVNVPSSWVANLFFDEINAMGIKPTFEVEPIGFADYE